MVNRTGFTINLVQVAVSGTRNWSRNLLDGNVLRTGNTITVRFPRNTHSCVFDVWLAYTDGDQSVARSIDLCRHGRFGLTWDNARRTTNFRVE